MHQGDSRPRIVLVGCGFGGLEVVRRLHDAPVEVTVIDRRNFHLFQPLLYQVATAGLSPGDISSPIRFLVRRQRNAYVMLGDVTRVDLATRRVMLRDGEQVPYDYLVLATGSETSYFGHDEWEAVAPGLKTVEDALDIRRRILLAFEAAERETDPVKRRALLTFVVVGGGPTGVELAGAMAEIARHTLRREYRSFDPSQARIILVEAAPRILGAFPEELSARATAQLQALGVEVMTSTMVKEITESSVAFASGDAIQTPTALWAAGVRASPLARTLGVELDRTGRVLVEPDLSIPGHPEVFVIGDLAAFLHQGQRPLPGVAPVAMQEGRATAANIHRLVRGLRTRRFVYRRRGNLATIGRAAGVADFYWIRLSGFIAWLSWLFVHIFFLIGFDNRLLVLFQWAWSYFTYQRSARLITGDVHELHALLPHGHARDEAARPQGSDGEHRAGGAADE